LNVGRKSSGAEAPSLPSFKQPGNVNGDTTLLVPGDRLVVDAQVVTLVLETVGPVPTVAAVVAKLGQRVLRDRHDDVIALAGLGQLQELDVLGHLLEVQRKFI